MENNEKSIEVKPTEIEIVKTKKPNFVVKAGRWIWSKKWYLVTGLASFAAGALLSNARDEVAEYCEEEPNEGPTEE